MAAVSAYAADPCERSGAAGADRAAEIDAVVASTSAAVEAAADPREREVIGYDATGDVDADLAAAQP